MPPRSQVPRMAPHRLLQLGTLLREVPHGPWWKRTRHHHVESWRKLEDIRLRSFLQVDDCADRHDRDARKHCQGLPRGWGRRGLRRCCWPAPHPQRHAEAARSTSARLHNGFARHRVGCAPVQAARRQGRHVRRQTERAASVCGPKWLVIASIVQGVPRMAAPRAGVSVS